MKTKELKFKVGDKVRVKSLEWYNDNKNNEGVIFGLNNEINFIKEMAKYCGQLFTIQEKENNYYLMYDNEFCWQDWMLEDEAFNEEEQEDEQLNKNNMETKEMTQEEVLDFLKNKKIRCDSEQESIDVQNKLFDLGINWLAGVKELEKHYLFFINEKNQLTYREDYSCWIEDVREELKVQDILSIQIKEEKPKFDPNTLQPFDRVLVRQGKHVEWVARFFDFCEDDNYYTTSGSAWVMCVPYNEETKHLHKTTEEEPEFYKIWK